VHGHCTLCAADSLRHQRDNCWAPCAPRGRRAGKDSLQTGKSPGPRARCSLLRIGHAQQASSTSSAPQAAERRTAWQPSTPWRRWCRTHQCQTSRTLPCDREASADAWVNGGQCVPQIQRDRWRRRRAGPASFQVEPSGPTGTPTKTAAGAASKLGLKVRTRVPAAELLGVRSV